MNIAPTILRKKIEDLRDVGATLSNGPVLMSQHRGSGVPQHPGGLAVSPLRVVVGKWAGAAAMRPLLFTAEGLTVTSVIRSDLVDTISLVGARWRVDSSHSPPTSSRYIDALLMLLISVALILSAIVISSWWGCAVAN